MNYKRFLVLKLIFDFEYYLVLHFALGIAVEILFFGFFSKKKITSLCFYFHRSSMNFVCNGIPKLRDDPCGNAQIICCFLLKSSLPFSFKNENGSCYRNIHTINLSLHRNNNVLSSIIAPFFC